MDVDAAYDPEDEQRRLALVLFPRYERMLTVLHRLVESAFPELNQAGYVLDDADIRRMLALAAERVVLIDESTQRQLQEVMDEAEAQGKTGAVLAAAVAALYAAHRIGTRAKAIAATELAEAQRAASLDRYRATGLVQRVQIVENPNTDAACAARNGQIVPIFSDPPLLHPFCRMRLVPVVNQPEVAA